MLDYITGSMQQMDTDMESARPEPNQGAEIMAFLMKRLSGKHTCCGADIGMHTTVTSASETFKAAGTDIGRWLQLFKKYDYHIYSPSKLFRSLASCVTAMSQYSTGIKLTHRHRA